MFFLGVQLGRMSGKVVSVLVSLMLTGSDWDQAGGLPFAS